MVSVPARFKTCGRCGRLIAVDALNPDGNCEQICVIIAERDALQARFEVLTVALTEIAANRCEDRHDWCSKEEAPREDWCNPCIARAALAAGETESEAPKQ